MIPYLLAAVGGYLLGDSMKKSEKFADGGGVNPKNIKVGDVVKLTTVGPKGKVIDIIESPAPFVSMAKIDWEDKKDRGLMYVTHIKKYAHGGVLEDVADVEIEIETMNSSGLTLEVEFDKYDGTEEKYYFEYFADYDERTYSLHAIYDENRKRLPKEKEKQFENDTALNNQIDNSLMDAFERYKDERYESRRDYEEE